MIAFLFIFAIVAGALIAYQCVYDEEIKAKAYADRYNRQQRIREKAMQLIETSSHRCPTGEYEDGHCPVCPLRDQCYPTKSPKVTEDTLDILPSLSTGNEEAFLADSPDSCPDCYEDDLCSDHDDSRFFAYASDEAYNEWYGEADAQESRSDNNSLF